MTNKFLTLGQVAELCGVNKITLYRMEKRGLFLQINAVPRRLRHGTKARLFTLEQAKRIKDYREETEVVHHNPLSVELAAD
ncbi:MAG TPA: hypothetical protein ENI23_11700 [bacterium]|nr:hypothetical protein [bacterium]